MQSNAKKKVIGVREKGIRYWINIENKRDDLFKSQSPKDENTKNY